MMMNRVGIALIAMGLLGGVAYAEAPAKLNRIDFTPGSTVTSIQMFSERPLTYHSVSSRDDKLIIDVDNVSTEGTIETHFLGDSQFSTISNVVIQPLSDHSLRLIVRGEHLGAPQIRFENKNQSASTQANKAPFISESMNDIGNDAAVGATVAKSSAAPIVNQAPPKVADQNVLKDTSDPITNPDVRRPMDNDPLTQLNTLATDWHVNEIAQYGLLGLLALGLGWFIRRKIQEMLRADNQSQFEHLLQEQAQGKRVGFREMAEAYQQQTGEPIAETAQDDLAYELLAANHNNSKRPAKSDSLIGLRGLIGGNNNNQLPKQRPTLNQQVDRLHQVAQAQEIQQPLPQPARQAQPQARPAEPRRPQAAPTTKPQQQPALPPVRPASRQAVNQYAQQQQQPVARANNQAPAARTRKVTDDVLRQELKRNQDVGKTSLASNSQSLRNPLPPLGRQSNRTRTANDNLSKAGEGNQVNGGNPEVLNFLRDVAHLMEKDGKPTMAQAVQRNIRPI